MILLRHELATLAYRAGKALRGAPPEFAAYKPGPDSRSAVEIVAHLGDLMDWATSINEGDQKWNQGPPQAWDVEVARFFESVAKFDQSLAAHPPKLGTPEQLFQGPIADALTHVGQLTMMRRLAGAAIRAENYHKADIKEGRVGPEQAPPKREF
jgi:hypothetical protein